MSEIFGFDAFSPKEIVERVQFVGVTKARLPLLSQMTLGILAGGFIGLGALYYTVVASDGSWALPRAGCLADSHFRLDSSFGLILVVVAGAELFTGNNLLVMAWTGQRITTSELLRNWTLIYLANFIGALVWCCSFYGHTSGR